jgi:murein DD-endopeptidase MepM/ murein hydrolase activator NlpD
VNQNSTEPQSRLRTIRQFWSNKRNRVIAGCAALCAGIAAAATLTLDFPNFQYAAASAASSEINALPVIPADMQWGFAVQQFDLQDETLRSGSVLGEILMKKGLTYPQVAQLVDHSKACFNINAMRAGRDLHFLSEKGGSAPLYMIYEPSPYEYVVFGLREPFEVKVTKRDLKVDVVAASGVLETSFWQALTDNGLSDELADGMIDILASSVDFYHQKQGDRFKVVYEQHVVEGKPVGTGKILAALYEREGKEYYAFNYNKPGEKTDYFDFEGRPARKAFLKSPVKFSRISSRFNRNRLHPVLGYHKAHFGTDYAAPHGTPIMAVAEGTVLEATRRGGNGNFVKIRHNQTYETQYLHMSGFAKGIRPGTRVAQGQTIGYVGSTGLATGPHVCFRFWKNGQQVDHLRLNLPQPEPMTGAALDAYKPVRDEMVKLLQSVQYRTFGVHGDEVHP